MIMPRDLNEIVRSWIRLQDSPYLVNENGTGGVEVRHLEEKPHQALRFPPELVVPIGRKFGRLSQKELKNASGRNGILRKG
jgi:hypothetical protein